MFFSNFPSKALGFLRVSGGKVPYFTESRVLRTKDKIALQGAGNRPRGVLRITLFSVFSSVLRVSRCMPPGASFPSRSCQERVKYSGKQCKTAPLFLWFDCIGASCLDSCHCTHCSENHGFKHVPRVSIMNQTGRESRLSARVAGKHVNKGSIIR